MTLPAVVLDLANWKLTLPIGVEKNKPTEIKQPRLAGYEHTSYFVTQGEGVRFRAPVNGVTTSGSSNPRSELREMRPGGDWSSTDGQIHAMVWEMAFTHLPNVRTDGGTAGVVGGQIHDPDNDICVFRLEGKKLWLTQGNNTHFKLITDSYELGTRFTAMFVVHDGVVEAYYNGQLVVAIAARFAGAYFKAGCYTQANSSNSKPNDVSNYGEVVVYRVSVTHGAQPPVQDPPPVTEEPPPVVTPPDTTIVVQIIRHGEKPGAAPDKKAKGYTAPTGGKVDTHSLTPQGWKRAAELALLFSDPNRTNRAELYIPDVIYAADGPEAGERMKQTVSLLSSKLGYAPVLKFDKGKEKDLAKALKTLVGKSALVCWEHSEILAVVKALGPVTPKAPSSWPDDRFDVVLVLESADSGKTWELHQALEGFGLTGDKATVLK